MRDETKIFDGFNLQDANTVNMQSSLSKTSQMIGQTVTGRKCTSPDCFWCHKRGAYSSAYSPAQTFIRLKISRDTAWWGTYGRSGIISRFNTTWLCGRTSPFYIAGPLKIEIEYIVQLGWRNINLYILCIYDYKRNDQHEKRRRERSNDASILFVEGRKVQNGIFGTLLWKSKRHDAKPPKVSHIEILSYMSDLQIH